MSIVTQLCLQGHTKEIAVEGHNYTIPPTCIRLHKADGQSLTFKQTATNTQYNTLQH